MSGERFCRCIIHINALVRDSGEAAEGRYAATIQAQKSGDNATISRSAGAIARSIRNAKRKRDSAQHKKMSLLESLVSIAIISTVVMFAAPSLIKARENYQLDAVARQVAGKMQWTRIKAISRSRDCRMRVSSPTSYVVECQYPEWRANEEIVLPAGFRIIDTT